MKNGDNKLKSVLFGLNKLDVSRYIKNLHWLQRVELQFIEEKLVEQRLENDRLKQEYRQLEEIQPIEIYDQELLELSLGRINETIRMLNRWTDEELHGTERRPVETESLPVETESVNEESSSELKEQLVHLMSFQLKSTPSGFETKPIKLKRLSSKATQPEPKSALQPALPAASGLLKATQDTGFWEDTDRLFENEVRQEAELAHYIEELEHNGVLEGEIASEFEPRDPMLHSSISETEEKGLPRQTKNSALPGAGQSVQPRMQQITQSEPHQTNAMPSEAAAVQPDRTEDIEMIRSRYIVGKLAGEDLYDAGGRLIISQNAVITREAVKHADQAGKLAELIVNMKIPELGD